MQTARFRRFWSLLFLASAPAAAQQRPTLTPADYARWESIGSTVLAPDGAHVAWTISRVDGDGDLRFRAVRGDSTHVVVAGSRPAFSADGRWLAYWVGLPRDEREQMEKSGKTPRGKVAIVDLRTRSITHIADISDFDLSPDGRYIALHGYAQNGRTSRGKDLIVRELATGSTTSFGNVAEIEWQGSGATLAMIIDAESRAANGVRIWAPHSGVLRTLESDTARFTSLAWRDDADDLTVLRIRPDDRYADPAHDVIAWRGVSSGAQRIVLEAPEGVPSGRRIVDQREPEWSDDGATVFLGLRAWTPKNAVKPDSASADSAVTRTENGDTAGVQVWHAADVEIFTERRVNESFDRSRSWVAAWHLGDDVVVEVADSVLRDVSLSEGRYALGQDQRPYERERMFGPAYRDLYAIDVATGERERFAERVQFQYGVSPGGRYMLYVRDGDYWTYDAHTKRHHNITGALPTSFVNLEDDHTTEEKPPYGNGGWTTNDGSVLLYDRYDVWEVRPDGSGAVNLTNGAADRVRSRRVWLHPDDRIVDRSRPFYVALYGERTKQYGYGRVMPDSRFERLVLMDRNVGRLTKADSADVFMYRVEGFDDSPDMFVAGADLKNAVQVTRTNPFQSEYAWGRSEVIDFRSATGEELQAALFYPADYRPGQRYPTIVDIYEITSNTVHNYSVPSEQSAYNTTVFTQNGYFVLRPDIRYRGRDPGLSAMDAIVPAVERVIDMGLTERGRIGLVGHSWGGYQTAFAVTQTDLFSAAVAGAPLTNLISMYLSIYWNSGGTDARIFEIDQGRMEVPFWEDMDAYIRNSPLFSIQQMDTPLLVAFGDKDGAVDWHQGIELYNAARRAGKDMVLLVYEGENHSLAKKPNQIDYHRRIRQWFDHYLKGAPAPAWIGGGMMKPKT